MLALIEIPHQRPARINWYEDYDALLADAIEQAAKSGHEEPEDWADAVFELADDWHGHRLIQTSEDVDGLVDYQGHQKHRVLAMVDDLYEGLGES